MQKLLTLVASLSLVGCGLNDFPKFPEVKEQYYLDVQCKDVECKLAELTCIKFQITSTYPYQVDADNPEVVAVKDCNGVGGFSLEDTQKILNFTDDVQKYFENHKCSKQ